MVPTSFSYNAEHDAIDVGGLHMGQTKKVRDVQHTGRATIVVDDVLPGWQPRMMEIRGTAEVFSSGGKALGEQMDDTFVRIHPTRIVSYGIEPGETRGRSVQPDGA
jgi:pyridoxamine 5'-phosphate oxidase family protein